MRLPIRDLRVKDAYRRQMPLFVGSYMGEHNLYIPTRELVRLDAYQAQVIRIQYAVRPISSLAAKSKMRWSDGLSLRS